MKILSSTNYKQFKLAKANRQIIPKHVEKLKKAIAQKNLLHLNPIIVDGEMQIIDGQHRLQAAKELKLEVYYIVDSKVSDKDIASLNTNKSNWQSADYLNYYVSKGLTHYMELADFLKKWPGVTISTAIDLLSKITFRESNQSKFKNGNFEITGREDAEVVLKESKKIFSEFAQRFERGFLIALEQCMAAPEYKSETMASRLAQCPDWLQRRGNREQYVELLEKIYNYRSSLNLVNFRIPLKTRVKMKLKAEKDRLAAEAKQQRQNQ